MVNKRSKNETKRKQILNFIKDNKRMRRLFLVFAMFTLVVLTGCDSGPSIETLERNAKAAKATDESVAKLYQRSCASCHTIAATKAPLVGDVQAWQPRLDKGMNTLIDNVVNGFGGMPPFGMCMDCDGEDFEKLIEFMAQDHSKK